MINAIEQLYKNPYYYGHAFLKLANSILEPASKTIEALRAEEVQRALAPMKKNRVELTIEQVISLKIRATDGKSYLPHLSGLTFQWRASETQGKIWVSIVKGEIRPRSKKCEHRTTLFFLAVLGVVTAPVTLPATLLGMGIKAVHHRYFKRSLSIIHIDPRKYRQMAKVMKAWEKIALGKMELNTKPSNGPENSVFNDCVKMSGAVKTYFTNSVTHEFDDAYVCKDNWDIVQGILILRNDTSQLKIVHLVTHPHNISSPLNEREPGKIWGVETTLVHFAAQQCFDFSKESLYLEGMPSSQLFYTHLGFTPIQYPVFLENGDYGMEMTAERVRELLRTHIKTT